MSNAVIITFIKEAISENTPVGTIVAQLSLSEKFDGEVTWKVDSFRQPYDDLKDWSPADNFAVIDDKVILVADLDYESQFKDDYFISIYASASVSGVGSFDSDYRPVRISDVQETTRGTARADRLVGDVGSDKFLAGAGDDKLFGKEGGDVLYGGTGQDTLSGGTGRDTFLFKSAKESFVKAPDRIADFSHSQNDVIDLSYMDANTKLSGNQDFSWVGSKAFTGHAGEVRYGTKNGDAYVYADLNGDKKADFGVRVDHTHKLYADDFLF